jgi:hypothetical protein
MEFNTNLDYVFNGETYLIENINKSIYEKPFFLGKFIKYISIHYCGDILDQGKAKFENGIINENDFKFIIKLNY